jgi:hypothetical protein
MKRGPRDFAASIVVAAVAVAESADRGTRIPAMPTIAAKKPRCPVPTTLSSVADEQKIEGAWARALSRPRPTAKPTRSRRRRLARVHMCGAGLQALR